MNNIVSDILSALYGNLNRNEYKVQLAHKVQLIHHTEKKKQKKNPAPQDAHGRLVLQVYFGSNTSEFSAIHKGVARVY